MIAHVSRQKYFQNWVNQTELHTHRRACTYGPSQMCTCERLRERLVIRVMCAQYGGVAVNAVAGARNRARRADVVAVCVGVSVCARARENWLRA